VIYLNDRYFYLQSDLFLAAIQLSAEGSLPEEKLLHIYFPYTDSEFFTEACLGTTFQLLQEIDDFMARLRSIFGSESRDHLMTAVVVSEELQDAVDTACKYLSGFIPPDIDETTTIISGSLSARLKDFARMTDYPEDSGCDLGLPSVPSSV